MKTNSIVFIILVSYVCFALSDVYKQVDEDGNITYSNMPSKNAEEVDLPPILVIPSIDSEEVDTKIRKRIELNKIKEQRETIEKKISEEENHLEEIKKEYKDGRPDRLGSERNYQRYINRVARLKEQIFLSEEKLKILKQELANLPLPAR